ncbi:beta-galactosidase GalB [Postechiella marina]|uniref:Beta-galactosidase GalB n=1 Tax=Postechiella marina TaxID=943941 RepID=A0ABP8CBE9_9FLAO
MLKTLKVISICFITVFVFSCSQQENTKNIADQEFNKNWLFHKGEANGAESSLFNDASWRTLNLPHDWAIEGPFDNKYNARNGGLPVHGTGWYRKHFNVSKNMQGKQISVEFDGAMNNTEVWINGEFAGKRHYGYVGFEIDLTPFVKFGQDNVIAVKLSPKDLSARWYTGAGIYRNVRIKYNAPVHIPQWGTYITTPVVNDEKSTVNIETKIVNKGSKNKTVTLETVIFDKAGKEVAKASKEVSVASGKTEIENIKLDVVNPNRWDLNNPYLYSVTSSIISHGQVTDKFDSEFGFRTIEFTANNGFILNGKRVQLNGVCMHHDLGPLGASVNYRATERQMEIMKSMGVNSLRTSHNPPSPEMIKVCDRLGIVVQVEAFDEWKVPKVPNGYSNYFDEWHERDIRDMIKRDRNHPSVIMWSIGNEILEQGKKDGWKTAKLLNDICHDEDPTRPTTAGFNNFKGAFKNKLVHQIDLVGMNYWPLEYKGIKEKFPNMIFYGSETSSQTSSRGVYNLPISGDFYKETGHVSSYDVVVGPPWAYPPDAEFEVQEANPESLGEYIWTGFDYLGEPTPYGGRDNSTNGYWNDDWPSKSSYFAPVDMCGFPKDRYYLYQSQWTKKPMVHVLPHWNWTGKEGQNIPVFSYTNAEEVELFVNGKSYGKKVKGKDLTGIPAEYHGFKKGTFMSPYRVSWDVPYQPGSLKVVAYTNGKKVAEKEIKTAKKAARVNLSADRKIINADGKDLSFITVKIEDENGNFCPLANHQIDFKIEGAGELAAVGNGDQRSLELFQQPSRKAFNGLCLLVIKSNENAGEIKITATANGLKEATLNLITQ